MDVRRAVKGAFRAGKATLLGTANAVHGVSTLAVRQEGKVTAAARVSVALVGTVVKGAGFAVSGAGGMIQRVAQRRADAVNNNAGRAAIRSVEYLGNAARLLGTGVKKTGELTVRVAPVAGTVVGGATSGATAIVSEVLDSVSITESDIGFMREELRSYGERLQNRSEVRLADIKSAQRNRNKVDLLDTLVVGGMTLGEILHSPNEVPHEIEKAFALQYPDLAHTETFADAISHANPDQLAGLASGVKGKLFELVLLDHLNGGGLPSGFHAELAHSATQPGWDLMVLDPHGHIADLIQAKATESVAYVRQALDRYPDIDVTTTHGVYAHLAALGMAQHVADSGVPLTTLNADVAHAIAAATGQFHGISFVPSSLSLAVIGLSVLMDKRSTWEMAGRQFGERSAKAGMAVGAAKATLVMTQVWWIGLLAGVGSRALAAYGGRKRERYEHFADVLGTLRPLMTSPAIA